LIRRRFLKLVAGFSLVPVYRVHAQTRPDNISIFFDFERSELPDGAKQLIDQAVPLISPRGRVTIAGNCDSAEREPEKLGLARANAVLTHLLRHQSMSKVRFNVVSEGAAKPAIQTPPNTREARNRRVEIFVTG